MLNMLLHGGDYNPDQWLDRPEILKQDIEYMKEAHINCVSLGIFAWVRLEPEDGVYDFDWLEKIIDDLYANGIYTMLATPTGAMPNWLTEKYPECRMMLPDGTRKLPGGRHNFCPSAPQMRAKMHGIDSALSKRLGHHPGVIGWHLSNEYDNVTPSMGDDTCHCPYCEAAFRNYLRDRYKTLDNLNHAWWTGFWSHTFTDWEQIHIPSEIGEWSLHGIKLDWKRFHSTQMLDFCKAEIASVREFSDLPCGANLMGMYKALNYFEWSKVLDFTAYDSYPSWRETADDTDAAIKQAFECDLTRSFKKKPFILMESTPSQTNWKPVNRLKAPGMHELASLHAVAHGSDSVMYFQWRASRGSNEKFHGAVIGHRDGDKTRVFSEVEHLGARLERLSKLIPGSVNRPKTAIIYDWENRWAVEDAQAVTRGLNYIKHVMRWYRALEELGVDVDLVDMTDDLMDYNLVIAPVNHMYRGDYQNNVRRFVEQGGTYVTTYWSGEVDESDLCFLDEHPLRDLLGLEPEEIDVMPQHVGNTVSYGGRNYRIPENGLCQLGHAETAEVLGTYDKDFYQGYPAVTKNRFGEGTAYYVAAELEQSFENDLCRELVNTYVPGELPPAEVPHGVMCGARYAADGTRLNFMMNFKDSVVTIPMKRPCTDAETGEKLLDKLELSPYGVRILLEKV